MQKRLFLSFLFVTFSWIVISSLIAENDQSGSIDYEPEEFEELCYGYADAHVSSNNDENNLTVTAIATCWGGAISLGPIGQCNSGWYSFDVKAGVEVMEEWNDEIGAWVLDGYMYKDDAGEYYFDGFSDFVGAPFLTGRPEWEEEVIAEAGLSINSSAYTLLEGQWIKILYDDDYDGDFAPEPEEDE